MGVDQVAERDRHLFFHVARLVHVAGDAEQLRAGIVRTAKAREPFGAAAQDGRRNRNGFHIVHGRRAAIKPGIGREWRLHTRLALLAFKAFEQGRFLAADIGAGTVMDVNVKVPAIVIVLADQLGLVGLLDRELHGMAFGNIFPAQVDIAFVGAHRAACDHAAFDEEMRVVPHDFAVLARARLGLVAIHDQVMRTFTHLLRHEGPFQAGRESRAATAAQAAGLDLVADPVRPHREHFAREVPCAALFSGFQAR